MTDGLKEIAAALAHDLNNYLQVVVGNLELLKRRRELVPETVEAALAATRRSAALADRMHALGRLQPPVARAFDLNHLMRELGDSLEQSLGTGIRVELELAADLPSAFADPRAVHLALLELVANARAAMPNGGRLVLRTAHGAERLVVLEVADSGTGMSAEALARMRTPLLSRGQHGKPGGLGLHIVQACAQASGGRFELGSPPGGGTSAKLYLPSD